MTNIFTGIIKETAGQLASLQKALQEELKDTMKEKVPVKDIK
jgi:hypothetical protein